MFLTFKRPRHLVALTCSMWCIRASAYRPAVSEQSIDALLDKYAPPGPGK